MARKKIEIEGQLDFFDMLYTDNNSVNEDMMQFSECISCWCYDCKHNSRNESIPRDFAGEKKPCPSCDMCIENDEAQICIIGSSKEGCRLRAKEEGLLVEEDF